MDRKELKARVWQLSKILGTPDAESICWLLSWETSGTSTGRKLIQEILDEFKKETR